jgi:hypothetical protein
MTMIMIDEYGALVEWWLAGAWRKTCHGAILSTQILHEYSWDWTQTSTAQSQLLSDLRHGLAMVAWENYFTVDIKWVEHSLDENVYITHTLVWVVTDENLPS